MRHARPTPAHHTDHHHESAGDPDADVIPFHDNPHHPQRQSLRRYRVEHIETEPMTTEQYELAVTMLAALITQWQQHHDNVNKDTNKAA